MSPIQIGRRALLGGSVTALALTAAPTLAHAVPASTTAVSFTLNATTLDGGEQVTSLTLNTAKMGRIDPRSLTTGTFRVHAKAVRPAWVPATSQVFTEYDLDRTVTNARLDNRGNIVLKLATEEGVAGGGTLGYCVPGARNVQLTLTYTLTQTAPLRLRNHCSLTIKAFRQGKLVNAEVDAFSYGVSAQGMNYRLFSPKHGGCHPRSAGRGKRPLVVWLHGGGEGGWGNYYDNEATLRANRGALGFATRKAQSIFGGAYVVAPQCISAWMLDGPAFAPVVKALIDELAAKYPIDRSRIVVAGCSNGGYMSLEMTNMYHDLFAASVPICCAATPNFFTDAELKAITTPTWLVHSKDDTTLPWEPNTGRALALVPGAVATLYDHVIWDGHQFVGHWSWIYVAHNDPAINGRHVWQWMAAQRA